MNIYDNTYREQNKCIWIEDDVFEIDIHKDEVEIICDWDYGYASSGSERMTISRKKLLELLAKMDEV